MNKNNFLTVFSATLLSSCIGFAMEESPDVLATKTPEKHSLRIDEKDVFVTPTSFKTIEELRAENLGNTALKSKITSDLNTQNIPDVYKQASINKAFIKAQFARSQREDEIRRIARLSNQKIQTLAAQKKAILNQQKQTDEIAQYEALVSSWQEELSEKEKSLTDKQKELSILSAEIEELTKQRDEYKIGQDYGVEALNEANEELGKLQTLYGAKLKEFSDLADDNMHLSMGTLTLVSERDSAFALHAGITRLLGEKKSSSAAVVDNGGAKGEVRETSIAHSTSVPVGTSKKKVTTVRKPINIDKEEG
jgi:hypothetical protein